MSNKPENNQTEQQSTIFTEPEKAPVKRSATPGFVKPLCILLAAAVLITGAIFAVNFFVPSSSSTENVETTAAATFSITKSANVALEDMKNADKNAIANIKSIVLDNENGKLTVVPYSTKDEDGKSAVGYKMTGHDDIPQAASVLSSLAENVFNVTAIKKLSGDWTAAQCGLDKPAITVTVTMADSSTFNFKIGDKVPSGNGYYYGSSTLSDGIFILDSDNFTNFGYGVCDLVETQLIEKIEADGENDEYFANNTLVKYDSLEISGSRLSAPIKFNYVEDTNETLLYRITSPVKTYADDEKMANILTPLSEGFTAATAEVINPTESELEKRGLAQPYTRVKYTVKGKSYDLRFSKPNITTEGYCNCIINDVPVVYSVMSGLFEFLEYDLSDIRSSLMFVRNIETVDSLTVEYGSDSYKYNISSDEVISDADSDTTATEAAEKKITVLLNSKAVVAEDFQSIYQQIILVKAVDYLKIGASAPSGSAKLRLVYKFNDGNDNVVISFTKYDSRYYSYTINGIGDALVRYDTIDNIIDNFERLRAGKAVVFSD